MERNELKAENLEVLKNEISRYIFINFMVENDFGSTITRLSMELGLSKDMIIFEFRKSALLVNNKIMENQKIEYLEYINSCHKDGFLELEAIANYHNIDINELKTIFNDYIESFTSEEEEKANISSFSLEAIKKKNIDTLKYRVRGFSKDLKHENEVSYNNVNELDNEFLSYVEEICNEYYKKQVSKSKKKKRLFNFKKKITNK